MSRRKLVLIFSVWLVIGGAFAGYYVLREPRMRVVKLAGGSPGGTYHAMAQGIKAAVEQRLADVSVTILETGGSADNIRLVAEGQAPSGIHSGRQRFVVPRQGSG